jgi:hypothetical protein
MRADGDTGSCVVGSQAFVGGHLLQRVCGIGMGSSAAAQQRTDGASGLLNLPERIAAMLNLTKRVEHACASQCNEVLAIERRHSLCEGV